MVYAYAHPLFSRECLLCQLSFFLSPILRGAVLPFLVWFFGRVDAE